MKTPEVWQRATAERYARLGALVTRREMIRLDLAGVERQIGELQTEILAIERTVSMAAEVEAAGTPRTNGVADQATLAGTAP